MSHGEFSKQVKRHFRFRDNRQKNQRKKYQY